MPTVTAAQMELVDRLAVHEYGIDLLQMMENAGGVLARVVQRLWSDRSQVTVLAGGGGNVAAPWPPCGGWWDFGFEVSVVLDRPPARLQGATAHQAATLASMGIKIVPDPVDSPTGVVVDGPIGCGLTRAPEGRAADLIRWAATARGRLVSLDVPSGIDAPTGLRHDPHVHADVTVTLALPKSVIDVTHASLLPSA